MLLPSHNKLDTNYKHYVINHALEYVNGHIHANNIEGFWSVFKHTIRGTYIAPRYLQRYVKEQVFRFDKRENNNGLRVTKAVKSADGKRLTYDNLKGNK